MTIVTTAAIGPLAGSTTMSSHSTRELPSILRSSAFAFLMAAIAATATAGAPPEAPPADAPATEQPAKPADSDLLRGPQVSERDLADPERFTGRERAGQAPVSRPAMEMRALQAALDELALDGDRKARVTELRASFRARLDAFEAEARLERKRLADERSKAPADQPPSADFQKRMQALEARRPKLAELNAELEKLLSAAEVEQLKQRFADNMKTYREEAERKRKSEAMKRRQQGRPSAPEKDGAPAMEDGDGMKGAEDSTGGKDSKKREAVPPKAAGR